MYMHNEVSPISLVGSISLENDNKMKYRLHHFLVNGQLHKKDKEVSNNAQLALVHESLLRITSFFLFSFLV